MDTACNVQYISALTPSAPLLDMKTCPIVFQILPPVAVLLFQGLRGHGGFQAAAALSQLALVAVESHLLQGRGGRQWGRRHLRLGVHSRCYWAKPKQNVYISGFYG